MVTEESAILLIGSPSQENFEPLLSEQNVGDLCGQALTNHRGRPRGSSMWVVCYFRKYTLTSLATSRGACLSIPKWLRRGKFFLFEFGGTGGRRSLPRSTPPLLGLPPYNSQKTAPNFSYVLLATSNPG